MKLLLDENISYRIITRLKEDFPGSKHVLDIQQERLTDLQIWKYAKDNDFVIVTTTKTFTTGRL